MRVRLLALTLITGACQTPAPEDPTQPLTETAEPESTATTGGSIPNLDPVSGGIQSANALVHSLSWALHPDYPTVVEVAWYQRSPGTVTVEYSVDPDEWRQAPPKESDIGPHSLRLVGIPYGHEVVWRIATTSGVVHAPDPIITPDPPDDLPAASLRAHASDADDAFLLTSISTTNGGWSTRGPFYTVIFDREARPVWARRTNRQQWTLYAQVSTSGDHILYDQFPVSFGGDAGVAVAFRSYLDEVIEEIEIPGHHHAFIELPDGTLAWGSRSHGGGEALVEKAPGQKDETVIWTCQDDWPEAGGCRSNSLYYRASDQSYVFSFYTLETVVVIDRPSGNTLWWAGKSVSGGYSFNPPESQFWWQHGVNWTPDGNLIVSTHDTDLGPTTVLGREYRVDHQKRELTSVWDYDSGAYASTNGDIWRLSNGNTLHTVGSASELKEVDEGGADVWHLDFKGSYLLGRSQLIEDLYPLLAPLD